MEIKLPFEVEQHPLKIDIDYQYSSEDHLDDGTTICHVLYLLKIDFIAKKKFADKRKIGGGKFIGFPQM